jgi:glutaredoxin-like YruB-family protein
MKNVIVYSQPGCPPCDWVKAYLTERGVPFTVKDVSKDFSAQRELVGKYNSRSTPTVVVDDQVMIGFDPDKLEAMLTE